jgi:hypothetical protein
MKHIKFLRDENFREVALVPLSGGSKGCAILDADDCYFLKSLGMSLVWDRLPNGNCIAHSSLSPTKHVYPARVLLDAGVGEAVIFRDRDNSNLRRSNLVRVAGHGKRRDRDFLKRREGFAFDDVSEANLKEIELAI